MTVEPISCASKQLAPTISLLVEVAGCSLLNHATRDDSAQGQAA